MPVYEYSCLNCDRKFELNVRVDDRYNVRCPKCDKNCKLLVSKSSFILKGDGWARDNYEKNGN